MQNIFYTPASISQYDIVIEKLELDLKELTTCTPPEAEVKEYVNVLLSQIKEVPKCGSSCVCLGSSGSFVNGGNNNDSSNLVLQLDCPEAYPMEEYIMYVTTPSQIALAILSYAVMKYESVRNTEHILEVISKLMETSIEFGFNGKGFDCINGLINSLKKLTMAHMHEFVKLYPELNPKFNECYEDKLKFVVNDLWSGKVKGSFGEDYSKAADEVLFFYEKTFFTERL